MNILWKRFAAAAIVAGGLLLSNATGFVSEAQASGEPAVNITINGKPVTFDEAPVIVGDTTMVPMRGIFEKLGAVVDWDNETKLITASKSFTRIKLTLGLKLAVVSGEPVMLQQPPQLVGDTTMVPVRFISESLGATVQWENQTHTVAIRPAPALPAAVKLKPLDVKAVPVSPADPEDGKPKTWQPESVTSSTYSFPAEKKDWKTISTEHFQVYYGDSDAEKQVFAAAQRLDALYAQAADVLQHKLNFKAELFFLKSDDYEKASESKQSSGQWDPSKKRMLVKLDDTGTELLLMTIYHEMIHAITLNAEQSVMKRFPSWFVEGVATYHEKDAPFYAEMRDKLVYKASESKTLIPWSQMDDDSGKWKDVLLGYAESQSIYGYLAEVYGEPAIASVFYTRGLFTEQLRIITGKTIADLETDWLAYLKRSIEKDATKAGIEYGKKDKYIGELKHGEENGFGRYYNENGKLIYQGGFKEGKLDGQGTWYMDNGYKYIGELRAGKAEGHGTLYDAQGMVLFDGQFRDNAPVR